MPQPNPTNPVIPGAPDQPPPGPRPDDPAAQHVAPGHVSPWSDPDVAPRRDHDDEPPAAEPSREADAVGSEMNE